MQHICPVEDVQLILLFKLLVLLVLLKMPILLSYSVDVDLFSSVTNYSSILIDHVLCIFTFTTKNK